MSGNSRNRLVFLASRRSKLEAEELLMPFVRHMAAKALEQEQIQQLLNLLDLDDITLLEAFAGHRPKPENAQWAFEQLIGFWKKR